VNVEKDMLETPTIKSIFFRDEPSSKAEPGQFIMVWIPGLDEIPMSVSYTTKDGFTAISARRVGPATDALFARKVGELVGVRGPYGRGFSLTNHKRALLVGGGAGGAPLGPLSDTLAREERCFTAIIGAQVKDELLFLERHKNNAQRVGGEVIAATEDGGYGVRGLASEVAEAELRKNGYDMIYTCGPELMIKRILDLSMQHSIPIQASLERIIKCGIGICGSCIIDSLRVCREGPVFDGEVLRSLEDLGAVKRDHSGRRVRV
jgi:dihydroorotate dehydrogenase electron transfer subunit